MDKKTLVYCLGMLNAQKAYMQECDAESVQIQTAYYDGMRLMLEAAVSEAFTEDYFVTCKDGKHTILA